MKMKTIDEQVFDGIRKTINRFREKPFHYFTEADIHSSLLNDIMTGAPDVLSVKENNIVFLWFTKNIQPILDIKKWNY